MFNVNVELYKQGRYDEIVWLDDDTFETIRFHKKQQQALQYLDDKKITNVGYGGAARGGKTVLICADCIFSCYAYGGIKNMIGRTTVKNFFETTFETMKNLYRSFGIIEGEDCNRATSQNTTIRFSNGSSFLIKDYTKQKIDDLGSVEIYRAYVDQSEQVNPLVIDKIIERVNTDRMCNKYDLVGACLEGFNPKKGHETTRFWIPYKEGKELDKRRFVRALPTDNPSPAAKQWVEGKESDYRSGIMKEADYQKQVKGNFDFDDDLSVMLPYEVIQDFRTNTIQGSNYYMIVDPAGKGKDELNISVFKGLDLVYFEEYATNDNVQLLSYMKRLKAKYNIANRNICYDVVGVGNGVRGSFRGAYEYASNSKPVRYATDKKTKIYNSLRDDCGYKLEELAKANKIAVSCPMADNILSNFNADMGQLKEFNDYGKPKRIMPKQQIKDNIGRSPTWLDIFLMRMVFELKTKRKKKSESYSI